jgi:sarcosine oxidase subunit alpha
VVFANTDSAYGTAGDLARSGASVQVVDPRPEAAPDLLDAARALGVSCHIGAQVRKAFGGRHVEAVEVVDSAGRARRLNCDLLASSGGWNPAIHLASQSRLARVIWSDVVQSFVAVPTSRHLQLAGAANGVFALSRCLEDGGRAGAAAVTAWGGSNAPIVLPMALDEPCSVGAPLWAVAQGRRRDKVFVDFSGDVTTADLGLAIREGFDSIELIKRYTTAGMGVDQGKTGNLNVIGVVGAMISTTVSGKVLAMWMPIMLFFYMTFEHSIVNMFLFPSGLLLGGNFSLMDYLIWNEIPTVLGNLVGGLAFTGLTLYTTHIKTAPKRAI